MTFLIPFIHLLALTLRFIKKRRKYKEKEKQYKKGILKQESGICFSVSFNIIFVFIFLFFLATVAVYGKHIDCYLIRKRNK